MNKYQQFPRFYGFRIYFISTLMYFMLVAPFAGFLFWQTLPDLIEKNGLANYSNQNSTGDTLLSFREPKTGLQVNAITPDTEAETKKPDEVFNDPQNDMLSKSFNGDSPSHQLFAGFTF
jgi:hypothetical protein